MTKATLRQLYKQKRSALTEKDRVKMDDLILINFQQLAFENITTVLNYWPLQKNQEFNTHLIADFLAFQNPGLQLAFPVTDISNTSMRAMLTNEDTDFSVNAYGIAEPVNGEWLTPEEIDLVFVPFLACDEKGYRVGYGKGFYDRFLATCRPDILKVGFSYFEPVEHISDINQFDVPLNICITPNRIYEF